MPASAASPPASCRLIYQKKAWDWVVQLDVGAVLAKAAVEAAAPPGAAEPAAPSGYLAAVQHGAQSPSRTSGPQPVRADLSPAAVAVPPVGLPSVALLAAAAGRQLGGVAAAVTSHVPQPSQLARDGQAVRSAASPPAAHTPPTTSLPGLTSTSIAAAAEAGCPPPGLSRFPSKDPISRACQHAALVLGLPAPSYAVPVDAFGPTHLQFQDFGAGFGASGTPGSRPGAWCPAPGAIEALMGGAPSDGAPAVPHVARAAAAAQPVASATASTAAHATAAVALSGQEAWALASAVWPVGTGKGGAAKRALAFALLKLGPGASIMTRLHGPHSMHHSSAGPILKAHSSVRGDVLLQEDATGCFR
jgi:hypothetical protein